MRCVFLAGVGVEAAFVGDERGAAAGVLDENFADVASVRLIDGERAGLAGRGIDKGDNA
jgi:hypothetical protein